MQRTPSAITANQAIEHGRMVYAVPGPIDRPTSAGSNRLIQQGAKLVTSAGDILDDLNTLFPEKAPTKTGSKAAALELSDDEKAVLECLSSSEIDLDSIAGKTGLPIPKVSSTLLALELKRLAKQLPGHQFVRL